MTVAMLASIIFAVILLQLSVVVLAGFYRRKRRYREISDRAKGNQAAQQPTGLVEPGNEAPVESGQGFREF